MVPCEFEIERVHSVKLHKLIQITQYQWKNIYNMHHYRLKTFYLFHHLTLLPSSCCFSKQLNYTKFCNVAEKIKRSVIIKMPFIEINSSAKEFFTCFKKNSKPKKTVTKKTRDKPLFAFPRTEMFFCLPYQPFLHRSNLTPIFIPPSAPLKATIFAFNKK